DARSASRNLNRVSKLRILDPACGSGSFLLGAYEFLLQWHLDFYLRLLGETPAPNPASDQPFGSVGRGQFEGAAAARWLLRRRNPPVVQTGGGWRLTIAERKRILLDNIYGVDIDAQAVENAKLSLLLKVLEGETQQSLQPVLRMFQERALPDLGANIKCGNSLIGPDFYQQQQMALFDEEERYRINVFDWPVFKNASTYPAIFVLSPKTTSSLSVKRIASAQHLNLSGVEGAPPNRIDLATLTDAPWNLGGLDITNILERDKRSWKALREFGRAY